MNQILPFLLLLVFVFAGYKNPVPKPKDEANACAQGLSGSHNPVQSAPGNLLQATDHTQLSFTIPLKRAGKLILMEAVIDSISGNIILDTGSTSLVLNSIYFRQGRQQRGLVAGGITGSAGAFSRSQIENVNISGIQFQHLEANITDLGHIEAARNIRVLGFVGLSIFSEFEVVIDLHSNVMELHRLDRRGNRIVENRNKQNHDIEIPVKIESHIVFLDGIINGRKLTFCLDTGAESNVLSIHLPNRVLNTVSILRRANLRGAGAQQVEVLYGIMNDFSIDRQNFEDMNTIVTNLNAMNHAYGTNIDGMLGCDFLERGIFYINLTKRTLGINLIKEERK